MTRECVNSDSSKKITCNVGETGVCAFHDVEIERRKNTESLVKSIPSLLTAVNRMIGFSVMASLLIGGAFLYTRLTSADLAQQDIELRTDVKQLTEQVSRLGYSVALTETKHNMLVQQMDSLSTNISALVNEIRRERESKSVKNNATFQSPHTVDDTSNE